MFTTATKLSIHVKRDSFKGSYHQTVNKPIFRSRKGSEMVSTFSLRLKAATADFVLSPQRLHTSYVWRFRRKSLQNPWVALWSFLPSLTPSAGGSILPLHGQHFFASLKSRHCGFCSLSSTLTHFICLAFSLKVAPKSLGCALVVIPVAHTFGISVYLWYYQQLT